MAYGLKKKNHPRGFTLLELLVSVGVLAIMGTVVAQALFSTMRVNTKTEINADVKTTGDSALQTMVRMLQNAQSVSIPCYTVTPEATSEATMVNIDGGSSTIRCIEDQEVLRIASDSNTTTQSHFLTGTNVTLAHELTGGLSCSDMPLRFTCTTAGDDPSSIHVIFSLREKTGDVFQFEKDITTFQTTVVLRN